MRLGRQTSIGKIFFPKKSAFDEHDFMKVLPKKAPCQLRATCAKISPITLRKRLKSASKVSSGYDMTKYFQYKTKVTIT